MKNLIYIITFCLPLLIIDQNEIQTESNFNGRHCRGAVGLCSIGSSIEGKNTSNSSLFYDKEAGLIFTVKVNHLSDEEVIKVLGEPLDKSNKNKSLEMTVEEDFELDFALVQQLKISSKHVVIKAGSYPVTLKDNLLQIVFEVN
jgi:hypothetical protein